HSRSRRGACQIVCLCVCVFVCESVRVSGCMCVPPPTTLLYHWPVCLQTKGPLLPFVRVFEFSYLVAMLGAGGGRCGLMCVWCVGARLCVCVCVHAVRVCQCLCVCVCVCLCLS